MEEATSMIEQDAKSGVHDQATRHLSVNLQMGKISR